MDDETGEQATTRAPSVPGAQYRNAREYAQALRPWLWHHHYCSMMNSFYMMLPYHVMATFPPPHSLPQLHRPAGSSSLDLRFQPQGRGHHHHHHHQQQQQQQTAALPVNGSEFIIPSLWRRILAEVIDFVLLFYIKILVTVMLIKHLGYIDLQKYELDYSLLLSMDEFDYDKAFAFTSEVIMLEIVNRICITIVETLCLRRGIGVIGGATPGKRIMGMKVISCEELTDLGNGRVRVTPAGNIGLMSALLRSVIKNFTITFFFPACLTVFFFDHNRTAYDILAGSIVVQPIDA